MIDLDDPIYLSLSDDDNYAKSENKKVKSKTNISETIVIDDDYDDNYKIQNKNNIIEIIDTDTPQKNIDVMLHEDITKISEENKLLGDIIEKCLDLEYSEGMLRVINRSLIKLYREADENYQISKEFQKVLNKTLNVLELDPDHKFSHVKSLCNTLKLHKAKKRVQLITLETNLKGNKQKRSDDFIDKVVKKPKLDVIELESEQLNVPIINLDDYEKENRLTQLSDNIEDNNFLIPTAEVYLEPSIDIRVANKQLEFEVVPVIFETEKPTINKDKIEKIEREIEFYKQSIAKLDQEEVCVDSNYSPYVRSEKLKAKIVSLYNELCELTGHDTVKRRTVRLQVHKGHPPGPVRKLEEFINSNIGRNGDPPFPDFRDVVQCVLQANIEDKLMWNKSLVLKEASALFTQCGRALQKRRQQREWHDLLATVKMEEMEMDDDPANEDPILLAKLEENRQIALRKEAVLLERYSMMQDLPQISNIEESNNSQNENERFGINSKDKDEAEIDIDSGSTELFAGENMNITGGSELETFTNKSTKKTEVTSEITPDGENLNSQSNNQCQIQITYLKSTINYGNGNMLKGDISVVTNSEDYVSELQSYYSNDKDSNINDINSINDDSLVNSIVKNIAQNKDNYIKSNTNSGPSNHSEMKNNINTQALAENLIKDKVCIDEIKMRDTEINAFVNISPNIDSILDNDKSKNNMNNVSFVTNNAVGNSAKVETNNIKITENIANTSKLQNGVHHNEPQVKIKTEPIDIMELLEALGNNYSTSIIDIEDPFLVIEISDSSDDEA